MIKGMPLFSKLRVTMVTNYNDLLKFLERAKANATFENL